ncbi:MAG: hypothetical protein LCH76_09305 [Actinobacteria bacterium]|nr:hypothetical protein [Actinomycetota bacterium]
MTESQQWYEEHLGPVEIIAFELPTDSSSEPWDELLTAVDNHQIRILDLEFLHRTAEDEAEVLDADSLTEATGLELPAFAGSSSGLLDEQDIVDLLEDVSVGSTLSVLLVEHLSLLPVIHSFESHGAQLVLAGPVSGEDLASALEDDEEL